MRATLGRPPVPISGFVHCVDDQREETEISCSPLSKMGEISLEKEAREIKKSVEISRFIHQSRFTSSRGRSSFIHVPHKAFA